MEYQRGDLIKIMELYNTVYDSELDVWGIVERKKMNEEIKEKLGLVPVTEFQ